MREQLQVTFKKLETDNHDFWSSCLLRLKISVVIYTAYDHYVSPIYKIDASFKFRLHFLQFLVFEQGHVGAQLVQLSFEWTH